MEIKFLKFVSSRDYVVKVVSTTLKDYYESFPVGDIGNGDTQVRFSRLREEMAFQKGLMIEVGCGKGSLGKYVKSGRSFRYVGLDFSFAALKHAKANCLDDMDYVCGDLHYLPFKDSVFKALLCSEVLEHVPRIQGLFPEFARVLNSDGQFFITVPNRYHINVYFTLWITGQGIGGQKYDNPPSFSRLLSHLKSNGFAINGVHFFCDYINVAYFASFKFRIKFAKFIKCVNDVLLKVFDVFPFFPFKLYVLIKGNLLKT